MKLKSLQAAFLGTAVALAPAALFAQNDPTSTSPATTQADQMRRQQQPGAMQNNTTAMQDSGSTGTTPQAMNDKMFIRKAAQGGMAEVKLGQLASNKATNPDVKSFGQKMVTDHTQLNEDMKPIADSMGVMLPKQVSKEDQAEYDKLNGMSGSDFDTEYVKFMVKDHHKDLREFRAEAQNAADPNLKAAVEKGEKVIQEHTMMADKLARSMNIAMPGRGNRAGAMPPTQ